MREGENAIHSGFRKKNMIRAGVWLSRNARAWSCDDCERVKGLRQKRGNCGGLFAGNVPHSINGRVPGYRIAPDSDPEFSEVWWERCPVAGAAAFGYVYQIYGALRVDGVSLRDIIDNPTSALVDALATIDGSSKLAHNRDVEAQDA